MLALKNESIVISLMLPCSHVHLCCRPLWVEYPQDPATFAVDNEYLIGEKSQLPPRLKVAFKKLPSELSPVDQITGLNQKVKAKYIKWLWYK